jgi:hypothetical protein
MGLRYMTRSLIVAALVVGCSSNSGHTADSNLPATDPVVRVETGNRQPSARSDVAVVSPPRHPFAGIDLTVHRLHWYVPQPE